MERTEKNKKLSPTMAMLLGVLATIEIMIAGSMLLHIDLRTADKLSILFGFLVLYFGVVACLADN